MIFVGCVLSVDVGIFRAAKDIVDAHIVKIGQDHKGLGGRRALAPLKFGEQRLHRYDPAP